MRRVFTIAAVAGAVLALGAPAASAAASPSGSSGWHPSPTAPFVQTDSCAFAIRGEAVRDEEETRVDSTLPDGSPRIQEFRGPLVMRFTNTSNGRSVVRDVTGYGRLHFFTSGASNGYFDGGVSFHIPIGNRGYPAGFYVLHGRVRAMIAADGTRTFGSLRHATIENLCQTLA